MKRLDRATALSDQVVAGLSNFIATVLIARNSTPEAFGLFAVGYAALLFELSLSRAYFGTIVNTTKLGGAALTVTRATVGSIVLLSPFLAILPILLIGFADSPDAQLLRVALGVSAPLLLLQDQLRFSAMALERPSIALLSDSVWLLCVVLGIWLSGPLRVSPVTWWVAGLVSAAVVALITIKPGVDFRGGWLLLTKPHRVGSSRMLGTLMSQGSALALAALLSRTLGPSAVGAVRGSGSLMAPVNLLLAFMGLSYTASMYRSTFAQQRATAIRLASLVASCAATTGLFFVVIPSNWGEALLGQTWSAVHSVIAWTAVGYIAVGIGSVGLLVLTVRSQARRIVKIELIAAALTISVGFSAAVIFGSVLWVVILTSLAGIVPALLAIVPVLSNRGGETPAE